MFLKWVLTTAGFSLAGAANLAALNLAIKPIGLEPKPLENLLLTLAPQSLVNSSVSNSNNLERSTPLKEKVLKVLFLVLAGAVSIWRWNMVEIVKLTKVRLKRGLEWEFSNGNWLVGKLAAVLV